MNEQNVCPGVPLTSVIDPMERSGSRGEAGVFAQHVTQSESPRQRNRVRSLGSSTFDFSSCVHNLSTSTCVFLFLQPISRKTRRPSFFREFCQKFCSLARKRKFCFFAKILFFSSRTFPLFRLFDRSIDSVSFIQIPLDTPSPTVAATFAATSPSLRFYIRSRISRSTNKSRTNLSISRSLVFHFHLPELLACNLLTRRFLHATVLDTGSRSTTEETPTSVGWKTKSNCSRALFSWGNETRKNFHSIIDF